MKLAIIIAIALFLLVPTVYAQGLKITEIDVHVDYDEAYTYRIENRDRIDSTTVSLTNNSKIDADILPGSNVTFTIRIENTFQGEDPTIKGVFARATIEKIDDGADMEEDSIDFDLEPGDDNRVDAKFSIPLEVDAITYNTIIEAEGEDKNNTQYRDELRLKLEVKKQSHDIRITRTFLSPSIVECDRKLKLAADMMNVGSNSENQLALELKSDSLKLNSKDSNIFLESSNEASEEEKMYTKSLNFIVPNSIRAGTYPILFNLYWKNFVLFDQKTENLIVKDCGGEIVEDSPEVQTEEEVTEEETEGIEETESEGQKGITEFISTAKNFRHLKTPALFLIIFGAVVILVIAAIVAFGFFRKKP